MPNPWGGFGQSFATGASIGFRAQEAAAARAAAARKAKLEDVSLMKQAEHKAESQGPDEANEFLKHLDLPFRFRAGAADRGTQGLLEKHSVDGELISLTSPGQYGRVSAAAGTARDADALRLAGVPQAALTGPQPGLPGAGGGGGRGALTPELAALAGGMGAVPLNEDVSGLAGPMGPNMPAGVPLEALAGGMQGGSELPIGMVDAPYGRTPDRGDIPMGYGPALAGETRPGFSPSDPGDVGGSALTEALEPANFGAVGAAPSSLSDSEAYLLTQTPPEDRPAMMKELNRAREARLKTGLANRPTIKTVSALDKARTEKIRAETLRLQRRGKGGRSGAGLLRDKKFLELRRSHLTQDAGKEMARAARLEQRLVGKYKLDKLTQKMVYTPGLKEGTVEYENTVKRVEKARNRAGAMRDDADKYTADLEALMHPPSAPPVGKPRPAPGGGTVTPRKGAIKVEWTDDRVAEMASRLAREPDSFAAVNKVLQDPNSGLTSSQKERLSALVSNPAAGAPAPQVSPAMQATQERIARQAAGSAEVKTKLFHQSYQGTPDIEKPSKLLADIKLGKTENFPLPLLVRYIDNALDESKDAGGLRTVEMAQLAEDVAALERHKEKLKKELLERQKAEKKPKG